MLRRTRTSRIGPLRRTLTVEALEDRTLLDGVVTAVLTPSTGLLQITGDDANNQITLAPSSTPGQIRITGDLGTSINQEAFVEFPLSAITNISMSLPNGRDRATVSGFSIPGALAVLYGNSADVFSVLQFSASTINISFSNPGSGSGGTGGLLGAPVVNAFTLTGVTAGALTLVTALPATEGKGISLSGSTIGTAQIFTAGEGMDRMTVSGSVIANLIITGGNDTIIVTNTQMAQASITSATGSNVVAVTSSRFTGNSAPGSLNVVVGGADPKFQSITLAELVFTTDALNPLPSGFLSVSIGDTATEDNTGGSTLTMSQITGLDAATVNVGRGILEVSLENLSARSLTASVGANAGMLKLNGLTTLADVTLNLGNGAQRVQLNALNVGRHLTLRNGDGNTRFTISNAIVGQEMTLITGNGDNEIFLNTVRVLTRLFIQAGSGTNVVVARRVICGFGLIDGGSGGSNTLYDDSGNGGFAFINFARYIWGAP